MSLNPKVTDQGNKVRLDWTPDLTGQGYRFYIDGVAVSRTFKPDASSTTFGKPDAGSHRYGVRKMDVVDALEEATWPVVDPPPPTGNYIDKLSELDSVFLPQGVAGNQVQQGVTSPPGLGGGVWEINDAAGSGFRFVATPQMQSGWESAKKVCLAQLLVRKSVGQYETWKFKYRYPAADNPSWPALFHAGTIFEFGHHKPYSTSTGNSGVYIGLDSRAGGEGHHIGVPTSTFSDGPGSFDYYKICDVGQLVKDKDYMLEARFRYNPDATGYCQIKIDGRTIIDESRPMRPPTPDIPKCQPGWYSNLGTTKNGVEIRNLEYAYGI